MADVLEQFYLTLKKNPNIKGLPGDYKSFQEGLSDPENSKSFFETIKSNPNIKGLPNTYDEFADGLGLKKKDLSTSGSQSGFAPSQNIKPGTAPLITQDKLQSQQYTPMPAEMRYKEKRKSPVSNDIALMDNFVGYMGDKIVKGMAKGAVSVPEFAGDLVASISQKMTGKPVVYTGYSLLGPSFMEVGSEQAKTAIQGGRAAQTKEGIEKLGVLSSNQYEKELNKNAEEKGIASAAFVGQSLGSLAESFGMGLSTGGAGFYTSIIEDAYTDAKKKGLSDGEAMVYGSTIGAVNGALEKYGMDALVKGMPKSVKDKMSKYLTNKVLSKLSKEGIDLTEDVIEKAINNEARSLYQKGLKVGAKGLYNAFTEGSTELGQEVASVVAENVFNAIKGKEVFKQEDVPMRFAKSFFGGAFGGGPAGSLGALVGKDETYNYIKENIASTIDDDAKYDNFKTELAQDLTENGIDDGKVEEIILAVDSIREKQKAIPDSVPAEARGEVIELQQTRDGLQNEIQSLSNTAVDPAFAKENERKVANLQGGIDAINDTIASKGGDKIIYRQTEKGYEKDIDGRIEPITQEQFDYADANNLEGIEIEGKVSAPVAESSAPVEEISTPLNTQQDATTETQKSIEAGSAEGSVEQYQGAQTEQDQTPTETDSGDSIVSSQEAEPQKVIAEAVSLYDDIMNAEGGAKKRSLSDKRRALLDANPRVKHIFENLNKIQEALGERITKEGNCP